MPFTICGFEHLHRHTHFSLLDGFAQVHEYAERMKEINQRFLCVTDHGVMGAVPSQLKECEKHSLVPLIGIELYVNPMQPCSSSRAETAEFRKKLGDEVLQKKFDKSNHLLAIAYTNEGYSNLVRMSSWGWIHGFYRKPRVNHDVLRKYSKGIIFSSCCAISETATAFFEGGDEAGFKVIENYISMFGKDHFLLEIMMLDYKMQNPYNEFILRAKEKYGLTLILTQDCHYAKQEHSHNQRLMLMQKNRRTIQEVNAMIESGESEELFELQDQNLWLKSEDELNSMWESRFQDKIDYEIFKEAKSNTVKIAERCQGVEIDRSIKLPKIPDSDQVLWDEIKRGFLQRNCPKTGEYSKRIKEEYSLICEKGFSSYFLIQKQMIDEARRACPELIGFGDGADACGPGRGSVCGSLVAYCLRLHDVEPIAHDLRFSRFLSPSRGGRQMRLRHTIQPIAEAEVSM